MNKNILALFLSFISWVCYAQQIQITEIKKHITYLASDALKGRGTGSTEGTLAVNYISSKFAEYKLMPKGNDGYFYTFTYKTTANPHDTIGAGEEKKANNVVAFLNNYGPATIVIGAHYDHLGLGYNHNSPDANPEGKIHNGADDNASGAAGVIELARYFTTN